MAARLCGMNAALVAPTASFRLSACLNDCGVAKWRDSGYLPSVMLRINPSPRAFRQALSALLTVRLLAVALAFSELGCTTPSTVATRRQERTAAYDALPAEQRAAVDQGHLKVGMSEDAVYIAWGKPAQILHSGDASGESTAWLYHGTTSDHYLNWRYRTQLRPDGSTFLDRSLERDLDIREYVSAELTFRDGRLQSWRTLPRPPAHTVFGSPGP